MESCSNSSCGRQINAETDQYYVGYNHQKGYEQMLFCSASCLKEWIIKKLVTMVISIVLGIILAFMAGDSGLTLLCLFLPYMLRQCGSLLGNLFDSGSGGGFISIAIIVLGTITVIYPVYKIIRETVYYIHTLKEIEDEA